MTVGVRTWEQQPGKGELDTLTGGRGADVFVLGNRNKVFYADGTDQPDYAVVKDFNRAEGDVLQLKGAASDYSLGTSFSKIPDGITIVHDQGANRELVAVVQGPTNFTLDSDAVRFV